MCLSAPDRKHKIRAFDDWRIVNFSDIPIHLLFRRRVEEEERGAEEAKRGGVLDRLARQQAALEQKFAGGGASGNEFNKKAGTGVGGKGGGKDGLYGGGTGLSARRGSSRGTGGELMPW